jgi:hypothetical protein
MILMTKNIYTCTRNPQSAVLSSKCYKGQETAFAAVVCVSVPRATAFSRAAAGEPQAGAAPWPNTQAATAPEARLAEKERSSSHSANSSFRSPGGVALKERAAPPSPNGPEFCVVGGLQPIKSQATDTKQRAALDARATSCSLSRNASSIDALVRVPYVRHLSALTRSCPQKPALGSTCS